MISNDLRLEFRDFNTVVIPDYTYRKMYRYRQTGRNFERGGAIAGYLGVTGEWVIASVMRPSTRSRAGRSWFERDLYSAQQFVNRLFEESDGVQNYLGEWHTHPSETPVASELDYHMLNDLLNNSRLEIDFLIGIILGDTGRLCVWYQRKEYISELLGAEVVGRGFWVETIRE